MASTTEVIKEYLVKLKSVYDNSQAKKAERESENSFKKISRSLGSSIASFSVFYQKAYNFLYEASKELISFTLNVGESDLAVERFARRMWTTEENARSVLTALDSLGMEYSDLFYSTNEQYQRFLDLNAFAKSLEAPASVNDTLVTVRDISFELSKIKTLLEYGKYWVIYYLNIISGGGFQKARDGLRDLTSLLTENLPKIAQVIARLLYYGYRIIEAIITPIIRGGREIIDLFDEMGPSGKTAMLLIGSAILAVATGPAGRFLMILGAILLLIEDYISWTKGRKTAFDWTIPNEVLGETGDLIKDILSLLDGLGDKFEKAFDITPLEAFQKMLDGIFTLIGWIVDGLETMVYLLSGDWVDDFNKAADESFLGHLRNKINQFAGVPGYEDIDSKGRKPGESGYVDETGASQLNSQDRVAYGNIDNSSIVNNNINVNNNVSVPVTTNASPTAIANSVVGGVSSRQLWTQVVDAS